jgi:hypothetical protein
MSKASRNASSIVRISQLMTQSPSNVSQTFAYKLEVRRKMRRRSQVKISASLHSPNQGCAFSDLEALFVGVGIDPVVQTADLLPYAWSSGSGPRPAAIFAISLRAFLH